MKLIKLKLENFKGIRDFELNTEGKNISVYGTNGTGKTSIADAFSWLLYDKPSENAANFSPKTQDGKGGYLHNLEHAVSAEIEDGGRVTKLRKVYREKWQTKGLHKTQTGHTTDYFVDGVPTKKTDYDAFIGELCPADKAIFLTQLFYFAEQLHWQKRRDALIELVGGITRDDIAKSNPEFEELIEKLDGRTVEQYLKVCKAEQRELQDKLSKLPVRIDEATKAKPDVDIAEEPDVNQTVATLTRAMSKLTEDAIFGNCSDERKQIATLQDHQLELEIEHRVQYKNKTAQSQSKYDALNERMKQLATDRFRFSQELHEAKAELARIEKLRETKAEEYKTEKAREYSGGEDCPFCKQPLPASQVAEAQEKFNLEKSAKLEEIRTFSQEKCSREIIGLKQAHIQALEEDVAKNEQQTDAIKVEIKAIETETPKMIPFSETAQSKSIQSKINQLQAKIDESKSNAEAANKERRAALQSQLDEANNKLVLIMQAKTQQKRIAELEADQRTTAKAHEENSRLLYLMGLWAAAEAELLTEKVNAKFINTKFKLFREQVNGDLEQICEAMPNTDTGFVLWADANKASKVRSGLEIIDQLGQMWGASLPVFIDNAESFVALPETKAQVIRLVVSEQDRKLRVALAL